MKIILGRELDGAVYRKLPDSGADAGTLTAGEKGLLDYLELVCGLPENVPSELRYFQYERAMRELDTGTRFYSGSFAIDPLGTARTVLESRDTLLRSAPSGFRFRNLAAAGGRLGTIAALEERFQALNPEPGVPDRIRRVLEELADRRMRTGLTEILLTDPLESWPLLFRELILTLAHEGVKISRFVPVFPESRGDLFAVKAALRELRERPAAPAQTARSSAAVPAGSQTAGDGLRVTSGGSGKTDAVPAAPAADAPAVDAPAVDGSLLLLRSAGAAEAADFVSALIAGLSERGERVVLVNGGLSAGPDDACLRAGFPFAGSEYRSSGVPVLEILPACLLLRFAPVEMKLLSEYLSLPITPVPDELRMALIAALVKRPGIGNETWRGAFERFLSAGGETALEIVRLWLAFGTVPEGETLPAGQVEELCETFIAWCNVRFGSGEGRKNELLRRGKAQAELILGVMRLRGVTEFTPRSLRSFLKDVGRGARLTRTRASETGSPFAVATPEAVLAPADTVVYWNFSESAVPQSERDTFSEESGLHIFSRDERAELERHGVKFLPPDSAFERHMLAFERTVSFASRRVILVCPSTEYGEPVNPHPIWYRMLKAFPEKTANGTKTGEDLTLDSGSWLAGRPFPEPAPEAEPVPAGAGAKRAGRAAERAGGAPAASAGIGTGRIVKLADCRVKTFPEIATLPSAPPPAEKFSPSSLELLAGCPLSWTLKYPAGLHAAETALPSGGLLYGTIAHDVLERYLFENMELEPDREIRKRLLELATDRITRAAAGLLEAGMDRERRYVTGRIIEAGERLVRALSDGGFRVAGLEQRLENVWNGIPVAGYADVVVNRKSDGLKAVIDLKWSGERSFRKLLERGTNLQTAAYSILAGPGRVPTAYFIIATGRFLSVHRGVFPGAQVVSGPDETEVWKNAERYLGKELELLSDLILRTGLPEKQFKEVEKSGEKCGFFLHAPCRYCSFALFCGADRL